MKYYDHIKIESEIQKLWTIEKIQEAWDAQGGEKRYVLCMFPYPSGSGLHVGHVESYVGPDIYARFLRMSGYNVLFPMGWDAFGLPAENYAIKTGTPPQETTKTSIETFKSQIASIGLSYDWSKELNTSSPEYYRWTQWLFLLFYKHGLAYKKKAAVNWCPSCQTVLANEQVVDGVCERCGTPVEKRELEQWFFNITRYADQLIDDLDTLDWPESTKLAQKNWVGRSEGATLSFPVENKTTYVLIHGFASGPNAHFHPWLKSELEKRGHTVVALEMPNPKNPDIREQVDFIKKNVVFDEHTVVIGHSLGSVVAMKVIESLEKPIRKLIMVGGFLSTDIMSDKSYFKTFDWAFDFEKIRKNTASVSILHDENDDVIPLEQATRLERALEGALSHVRAASPHFRADREEAVLEAALPKIDVFTTRPDTLFGATYLVLAPEHPLVEEYALDIQNIKEVRTYIQEARTKSDIERSAEGKSKTGVLLEGLLVLHPGTGKKIPVFIADYVLYGYGTGAIMAVPAHDERDFEFAEAFNLPIVGVIEGEGELPRTGRGKLVNSGAFDGLTSDEAAGPIAQSVGGSLKTVYRLRDWLVSRQRYWGAPIPIVYDPEGNPHPVPEEHLPWMLPTDVDFQPKGTSPLGSSEELKARTESLFGKGWRPEVDTMDTFVDSSWYFLRFPDPKTETAFADAELVREWMPVDRYVGGAEHTVLHLLYARFFTKTLRDLGFVEIDEPFASLRHQGMILGPDSNKMSKSKGNVINPNDMVERFGADTLRMYEMFMGPYEQSKAWSTDNMVGVRRFIEKVWRLSERVHDDVESERALLAETIQKVSRDIEAFAFNTAISSLMILSNTFEKKNAIARDDFLTLLKLLAPFAPHASDALWRKLGRETSIHLESWPTYNEKDLERTEVSYAVQVNGKVRDTITLERDAPEEDVIHAARLSKASVWINGGEVKKTIVVPNKIINFVVVRD